MNTKPAKCDLKAEYRVYIEQVNQTYVDVVAANRYDAIEKAYRKWRREDAHARISYVDELSPILPAKKGRK